ncbi:hypothetical protein DY000_02039645 [Brassica cretica]|uniref:Uncharacterized protein n=1 Tax=Brassica cretica TaxID=69181 RepID=A0ABQ7BP79_BRACR|nr:hypothetical protein DY000_02039645 [Brassica cretica]
MTLADIFSFSGLTLYKKQEHSARDQNRLASILPHSHKRGARVHELKNTTNSTDVPLIKYVHVVEGAGSNPSFGTAVNINPKTCYL